MPSYGGDYNEAIIGSPQFINPILISTNDADRDLSALVYSGLTKYDGDGNIIPDLAESYEVSADGLVYTFHLKKDVWWHDGEKFTADDVIFTIGAILNSDYGSPLRLNWQGISVEKQDDSTVIFKLSKPHFQFIEKTAIGILPRHIWEAIDPKNINLADANLKPIGTGPFVFSKFTKDKLGNIISYALNANENFYNGKPSLTSVSLYFYEDEEKALEAYKNGDVMGLSYVAPKNKDQAEKYSGNIYTLAMPKYFSVFFNQNKSKVLSDKNIRAALLYATDKEEIKTVILKNNAELIDSPIPPWLPDYNNNIKKYEFSTEKAVKTLEDGGWKDKNSDGIREKTIGSDKEPTNFEITLTTSDFPDHVQTAEILQKQWSAIGAKVNLESYTIDELKQKIIKQRNYDALIFGEVLSQNPDPYVFWHSSQKLDPGLNLAVLNHKDVDATLDQLRLEHDQEKRRALYGDFQKFLAEDVPAIFLYSPSYVYVMTTKVKGVTLNNINAPQYRFARIHEWYLKTQRVMK